VDRWVFPRPRASGTKSGRAIDWRRCDERIYSKRDEAPEGKPVYLQGDKKQALFYGRVQGGILDSIPGRACAKKDTGGFWIRPWDVWTEADRQHGPKHQASGRGWRRIQAGREPNAEEKGCPVNTGGSISRVEGKPGMHTE